VPLRGLNEASVIEKFGVNTQRAQGLKKKAAAVNRRPVRPGDKDAGRGSDAVSRRLIIHIASSRKH
jgi:hypothetical protein